MRIGTGFGLEFVARRGDAPLGVAPTLRSAHAALVQGGPPSPPSVSVGASLHAVAVLPQGSPAPQAAYRWRLDGELVGEGPEHTPLRPGSLTVTIRLENGVPPAAEATSEPVAVLAHEAPEGLPLAATGLDESLWIGLVTPTSVTATARLTGPGETRLVVSPTADFAVQALSAPLQQDPAHGFCRATIEGLSADAAYHLRVAVDGVIDSSKPAGRFRTAKAGAHSFSFAFASCASSDQDFTNHQASNGLVFDRIRDRAEAGAIDFFVHLGDLHYDDPISNNVSLFHRSYDRVFAAPRQNAAWRSTPMLYMWDDHDYGANDGSMQHMGRPAAVASFRARVPVALANPDPSAGVYYSFVRGRVRFILTDIRSERRPTWEEDDAAKVAMSAAQKAWFQAEIEAAKAAGQVVCWGNTKPWVAAPTPHADHWGGYATARAELAGIIEAAGMSNSVCIISGDMHAMAYDDGSSVGNVGGYPVCQAAPLERRNSSKGGPYLIGPIHQRQGESLPFGTPVSQYGVMDVTDTGGATIGLRFRGMNVNRAAGDELARIDVTFVLAVDDRSGGGEPAPPISWNATFGVAAITVASSPASAAPTAAFGVEQITIG
jgi:hypothetical protein